MSLPVRMFVCFFWGGGFYVFGGKDAPRGCAFNPKGSAGEGCSHRGQRSGPGYVFNGGAKRKKKTLYSVVTIVGVVCFGSRPPPENVRYFF